MLVLCSSGLIGDAFSSLPAICAMGEEIKRKGEKLYVVSGNREVLALAPQENFITINEVDHIGCVDNLETTRIEVISASRAWQTGISIGLHISQSHFKYLGLPIPKKPFENFDLQYDKTKGEEYDFLISPFSRSNSPDDNKRWKWERWQEIIDRLNKKNFKIGVLGASKEDQKVFNGVDYIYDKPLKEVCAYINKIKVGMLSIDNGLSHLTHGIGVPHLLLAPQCLPTPWIYNLNDNATMIRNQPINISIEQVWNAIRTKFLT